MSLRSQVAQQKLTRAINTRPSKLEDSLTGKHLWNDVAVMGEVDSSHVDTRGLSAAPGGCVAVSLYQRLLTSFLSRLRHGRTKVDFA